jgi:O-antigen ligase
VARIRSVYGSPNNLGLFLGRAIPIAAAVALLGGRGRRPVLYGLALLPLLSAAVFSFSRGALLLGIPAGLAVVALFWGGRRAALALVGMAGLGLAALIPLSRHPRFADLLSTSSGTGFFRINVWRSAWAMFRDRPLLGVGLDNFLYAYRGRYILPEAWQEPNLPHAHNIVLDALTRTGLLGLAVLLAMLAAFFRLAFDLVGPWARLGRPLPHDLRALAIGLLASMVNFIAHGMVDTGYWFVDLGYAFMMTLGLMAAISQLAAGGEPSRATVGAGPNHQ